MSTSTDELVVRLAREKGLLRADQLAAVREGGRAVPTAASGVVDALLRDGLLTSRIVAELLAAEFGLPLVDLGRQDAVSADALGLVPRALAVRHRVLPLAVERDRLRVAVVDPLALDGIDGLAERFAGGLEVVLAPRDELLAAIERCYGTSAPATPRPGAPSDAPAPTAAEREGGESVGDDGSDAPIIRLVESVIVQAVRRRASDIHWEPLETRFRVRQRIDGVLFEAEHPPKRLQLAVVSRIKIMAGLSIAEKRLPQDGRIAMTVDGRALDLRVSTMPTTHGESVVMRILDQESLRLGLPQLGFAADDRAAFERLLRLPDGLLLVTGPTGSGKTTTLYAALHFLNRSDRKIITVEDPVEYQLNGVNQVPVRPETGVTFASALRAILRQAPNVVMIGEIRDLETAEIAIHAALTGHLVFSTLHTNDAAGAITRLIDLGVKPFLIASALRAVLAQRLVRKTCEKCARPYAPPEAALRALGLDAGTPAPARFLRGAGCHECLGTGYHGRTAIFELLTVDEEMQRLIHDRARAAVLRARACANGMRLLRDDGARKASAGLTTIEEVVSITVGDASLNQVPAPRIP